MITDRRKGEEDRIMLLVCAWCGKIIGTKPPKKDLSTTHGICKSCAKKEQEKIRNPREE